MISKTIGCRGTNHFQTHPYTYIYIYIHSTKVDFLVPSSSKLRPIPDKPTCFGGSTTAAAIVWKKSRDGAGPAEEGRQGQWWQLVDSMG